MGLEVFGELEDNWRICRLSMQLQTMCVIADFFAIVDFFYLVQFPSKNLQDFCRVGGFLEDSQIICTNVDYLRNCGLFAQLWIICANEHLS